MSSKVPFSAIARAGARLAFLLLLFTWLPSENARGAGPQANKDITIPSCPAPPAGGPGCPAGVRCYAAQFPPKIPASPSPGSISEDIVVYDGTTVASGTVSWGATKSFGCSGTFPKFTCAGIDVTFPKPTDADTTKAHIGNSSDVTGTGLSQFTIDAVKDSQGECDNLQYQISVTASGGGWGDPHLTTVDGVHYDFQSAGEFTALRGNGLEIQTRQTPVATTFLPGANAYTGLRTCVAIYSAVAARVGTHRVSYEPNINGVPDPSGLQLRVDGALTTLGPGGIDLGGGSNPQSPNRGAASQSPGRIVQTPIGGGIEIDYADGTQLVVTPAWWADQQKWYLNVNVYGTTATEGIFGQLTNRSWLPALPDGSSLGPKPDSLHQRYIDLYEKFTAAWRVKDSTSLFDYAPGTSTGNFTLAEWPRENPQSCAIEGQPSAGPPLDVGAAERSCSAITDNNMKADCVFDVSVTGFTGFAQTYQFTQRLDPQATETTLKADKDPSAEGESVAFTAMVAQKAARGGAAPAGTAQFILDGGQIGNPIALDTNGRALWNTASLQVGQHQIAAKYIPAGWGGLFLASTSPQVSHTVTAPSKLYLWIIIALLIILLIAFLIWRYLRAT
jgi:Bacterial Ig-like domain (group 3)